MRPPNTAIHRAFLSLVALVPVVAATDELKPEGEPHSSQILLDGGETNETRIFYEEDEEGRIRVIEQKLTITTQHKVLPKTARCQATLAVQHLQYDATASVIGTIENTDCAASSGAYTIAVNIRDENGELQTLEFDESWRRSGDQPIEFSSDYPVGENVAILSVRALRLSCVCADTPGE